MFGFTMAQVALDKIVGMYSPLTFFFSATIMYKKTGGKPTVGMPPE
ncbi:MAG: hypothetical protein LBD16_00045 [Oscillospiraceae bacterium]|nr:hypothetical protein [Oscillospiraceae bacterium]